jgi:hypothetical protein
MWVPFMMVWQRKRIVLLRKNYALDATYFAVKRWFGASSMGTPLPIIRTPRNNRINGLLLSTPLRANLTCAEVRSKVALRARFLEEPLERFHDLRKVEAATAAGAVHR